MGRGDSITEERQRENFRHGSDWRSQSDSLVPAIEGCEFRLDQHGCGNRNPEASITMIPAIVYPN